MEMETKIRNTRRIYSKAEPNKQVAFRLDRRLIKMLDKICKKQIITRSHFVRQAVLKALTKEEENK